MTQTNGTHQPDAPIEGEIVSSSSLAVLARAEIDTAIATAHAYPRSIKRFREEARSLAILDEETAASCFYTLPRGGKSLQGPSVRLAEIVGSAWGNLRYGARVVEIGREFVTAQGVCHDLEKNVSSTVDVRRRITNKSGQRFNEDMIGVTANAACSLALRNAIFKVVPFAHVKPIFEEAKLVSLGKGETLAAKRDKALEYFRKLGVTDERICSRVERPSIQDLTLDDLVTLKGFATSIKDGECTVEEAFPMPKPEGEVEAEPKKAKTDAVADKLKERAKSVNPEEKQEPAPHPREIANEAAEQEAAERLARANQLLADIPLARRTWELQLQKHWKKTWTDMSADEQEQELSRMSGMVQPA